MVTHWDNTDGGATLDTSRCYMGQARFADLLALLPADVAVVGIAEHTALALDPATATLGPFSRPRVETTVPAETAQAIRAARSDRDATTPPADVAALVISREQARAARDWATADRLRREIVDQGWRIEDAPAGPRVLPLGRTPRSERPQG